MFGGNSNWRGPIWMPVNILIVRALLNLYAYYGNEFTVECPTGSGKQMNLFEVSREISKRLGAIFLRNGTGLASGLRRHSHVPVGSPLARSRVCSMSISMAIPVQVSARVTRPAGPVLWDVSFSSSERLMRMYCSKRDDPE